MNANPHASPESSESRQSPSILVDTVPIVPGRTSTGVKVYLVDLLKNIPEAERARVTLLTTRSNADVFEAIDGYETIRLSWHTDVRVLRVLTQQLVVPLIAAATQPDVLLEPVDTAAVLAPVPIVTSMHSSHINMQGHQMGKIRSAYNQLFLRLTARRSSRMIAISEFVKDSLSDILNVPSGRIRAVYHGGGLVEEALARGWTPDDSERTGGIFFISTLYPHKNAEQLIRAYARLRNRRSEVPDLTIAGGDTDGETPTEEEGTERERLKTLAEKLNVRDDVHFPGRISDEALLNYLATERLMVFPSSLEGFGIPALEAMQAGLPLVASDQSSVPEIVGEGGLTVDPHNIEAMTDKMEVALFDEDLRERLVQSGLERGKKFSWKRTAQRTLEILDGVGK